MKRCPKCHEAYSDVTLIFCRQDGSPLENDLSGAVEEPTRVLSDEDYKSFETAKIPDDGAKGNKPSTTSGLPPQHRRRTSRKSIDSLAIMPLLNTSTDLNMEFFSDGITESVINALSQVSRLRVVARSTVFRYKQREVDPQEVGKELKVRAVLTGRIRQIDDSLMIAVELIDVNNDAQLWGAHYNRKLSDIFDLQEEIANEIAEKLRLKLTGEERKLLSKRYTEKTEAYQLYLKGLYFWNKQTPDGIKTAIAYFQQAIESDPGYALAYAGLSYSYGVIGLYGPLPPREVIPKAKTAALKALEIDQSLAEGYTALAVVSGLDWDLATAGSNIEHAIALNPNYATAYYFYAYYLIALGRLEEAREKVGRAQELDPLSAVFSDINAFISYLARQYDKAIQQWQDTLEMDSNFFRAHLGLGWVYTQMARYQEAIAACQKAIDLSGGYPWALAALGHAYAAAGRGGEALAVAAELNKMSEQIYVSSYDVARIYVGLEQNEKTIELLEKACDEKHPWMLSLKSVPVFDHLRSDPRFSRLLERIELQVNPSRIA